MFVPDPSATRTSSPPSLAVWLPPQVTPDNERLRRRNSALAEAAHKRAQVFVVQCGYVVPSDFEHETILGVGGSSLQATAAANWANRSPGSE
jgi:hypothetical protein